jgi:hypothetical protein
VRGAQEDRAPRHGLRDTGRQVRDEVRLIGHALGGRYPDDGGDGRIDRHDFHECVLIPGDAGGCRELGGAREDHGIGGARGVRIGDAVDPREGIVYERVRRANRGSATCPVLDVAMRADAVHPVKSGGAAPRQEPVTSKNERKAPGPLNREAGLSAQGEGAVVEEIVGGRVGGGRVELDRLRQGRSSAVRSVEDGAAVEGQHDVPGQLVSEADLKIL